MSISSNNLQIDLSKSQPCVAPDPNAIINSTVPPTVVQQTVVLPNQVIYLVLVVHANACLGNPSGIIDTYQPRPAINRLLDIGQKLHKAFYNQGCRKFFDGYGVDAEGRHAFVAALTFKIKQFSWGGDCSS